MSYLVQARLRSFASLCSKIFLHNLCKAHAQNEIGLVAIIISLKLPLPIGLLVYLMQIKTNQSLIIFILSITWEKKFYSNLNFKLQTKILITWKLNPLIPCIRWAFWLAWLWTSAGPCPSVASVREDSWMFWRLLKQKGEDNQWKTEDFDPITATSHFGRAIRGGTILYGAILNSKGTRKTTAPFIRCLVEKRITEFQTFICHSSIPDNFIIMILPDDPSISSQVGDSVSGVDTISQPNRPQVRPVAVKG